MENYLYQCRYCGKEYKPNRRHKQIFCSNSCRTNSHIRNKKSEVVVCTNTPETTKLNQIEKTSWAGIKNATAGALIAEGLIQTTKAIFIKDEDKPATKKDIKEIITTLKGRYFRIKNAPKNSNGELPYYDILTQTYVYK